MIKHDAAAADDDDDDRQPTPSKTKTGI